MWTVSRTAPRGPASCARPAPSPPGRRPPRRRLTWQPWPPCAAPTPAPTGTNGEAPYRSPLDEATSAPPQGGTTRVDHERSVTSGGPRPPAPGPPPNGSFVPVASARRASNAGPTVRLHEQSNHRGAGRRGTGLVLLRRP